MADELFTAGKLAKEWGVPPKDVKTAIEKAGIALIELFVLIDLYCNPVPDRV